MGPGKGKVAVPPPLRKAAVRVSSGRTLGVAEFGAPGGRAVLWFHGTPGARQQLHPETRRLASEEGIRVVTVERPGIGESTPHLYTSIIDWVRDINGLTSELDIDRFAVVGLSGGGPYALACAHELPERVVAAAILGGVAPTVGPDAVRGGLASLTPHLGRFLAPARGVLGRCMSLAIRALAPFADPVMDLYLNVMPPGDRRVFADLGTRRAFQQDLIIGSRGGMESMFADLVLFGRPWGFSLRGIRVPVGFWHGDADTFVPLSHGQHMAALIPSAELYVRPEEGHLGGLGASREVISMIQTHWEKSDEALDHRMH